jgi:hypothetical protein
LSAFAIKRSVRVRNTVLFRFAFAFNVLLLLLLLLCLSSAPAPAITVILALLIVLDEASVTFYRVADRDGAEISGPAQNTTSVKGVLELPGLY